WDGATWSALGSGLSLVPGTAFVLALGAFDDGSGPALYVGGEFTAAGGVVATGIAKWDGTGWSALGSGLAGAHPIVAVGSRTVFDDGSGPALYAGGDFTAAGSVAAIDIAAWNGTSWSAVGTGSGNSLDASVNALTVFDDGSGPALYAGGGFVTAGGA